MSALHLSVLSANASSLAKEYIYLNGRVIAIENSTFSASPGLPNPPPPTPPVVVIESPAPSAAFAAGTVTISGYVLDSSNAVSEITASIGGVPAQAATFVSRPDICSAHPGIQGCPNVGWTVTLNTASLAMQNYTITVNASDGHLNGTASLPFSIVNPTRVHIDVPNSQSPSFLSLATFSGWALSDSSAIASVTVSVDNPLPQAAATYGASSYACNDYPGRTGCPNVGWTYNVNTAALSNGTHTFYVKATSTTNSQATASIPFSVFNGTYPETTNSLGSATLFASPNPMQANSSGYGTTTLQYNGSPSNQNEIRVGSPDGPLLTSGTASAGSGTTGAWVTNGMTFFLQDVGSSMPLTINHTMATLSANVQANGVSLTADRNPLIVTDGSGYGILTLSYSAPGVTNTTVTVGPNYTKFCGGGTSGTCQPTGKWVSNGMEFFLHNTPNGATPNSSNVIANFTATVLDLGAPGFVLSSLPRVVSVGARPSFPTLELDSENGFSSPVALSSTGVPAGASVAFYQNNLVPSTQIIMTVTAPLSTPWSYVTLTGQSGTMQHNDVLEIQNLPPQITGYNTGSYGGGNATITVNATDAEADLSYVQINIAGSDNQGTCAATVSFTAGPSMLPNVNANGACSVVSTAPAGGNGSSGSFTITFHFDSTRFYGSKNVSGFVVEQSGVNTSEPIGGIDIPQNQ